MFNKEVTSVLDLIKAFPDEQSCIDHLEILRWGGVVVSPFDASSKVYKCKGNKYQCKNTGKYFNVKTGTLFDNTKIELQKWFLAIWLVTSYKKGISSLQLGRELDITQKTAWFMLHRIRKCFGIDNDVALEGEIELDETFVGGKNKNRHADKKVKNSQGRSFKDKTPVMGMMQKEVSEIRERPRKNDSSKTVKEKVVIRESFVRCRVVADTKVVSLQPVIRQNVVAGSTLISDEWFGYEGLSRDYDHRVVDHGKKEYVNENGDTTNTLEGFWTWFKRSCIGIYHFMSRKHMQQYANEVAFRYNTRKNSNFARFNTLLSNLENRLTYNQLVRPCN